MPQSREFNGRAEAKFELATHVPLNEMVWISPCNPPKIDTWPPHGHPHNRNREMRLHAALRPLCLHVPGHLREDNQSWTQSVNQHASHIFIKQNFIHWYWVAKSNHFRPLLAMFFGFVFSPTVTCACFPYVLACWRAQIKPDTHRQKKAKQARNTYQWDCPYEWFLIS